MNDNQGNPAVGYVSREEFNDFAEAVIKAMTDVASYLKKDVESSRLIADSLEAITTRLQNLENRS